MDEFDKPIWSYNFDNVIPKEKENEKFVSMSPSFSLIENVKFDLKSFIKFNNNNTGLEQLENDVKNIMEKENIPWYHSINSLESPLISHKFYNTFWKSFQFLKKLDLLEDVYKELSKEKNIEKKIELLQKKEKIMKNKMVDVMGINIMYSNNSLSLREKDQLAPFKKTLIEKEFNFFKEKSTRRSQTVKNARCRRGESRKGESRRGESRRGDSRRGESRRRESRRREFRREESRKRESRRGESRRGEPRRGESRRGESRKEISRKRWESRRAESRRMANRSDLAAHTVDKFRKSFHRKTLTKEEYARIKKNKIKELKKLYPDYKKEPKKKEEPHEEEEKVYTDSVASKVSTVSYKKSGISTQTSVEENVVKECEVEKDKNEEQDYLDIKFIMPPRTRNTFNKKRVTLLETYKPKLRETCGNEVKSILKRSNGTDEEIFYERLPLSPATSETNNSEILRKLKPGERLGRKDLSYDLAVFTRQKVYIFPEMEKREKQHKMNYENSDTKSSKSSIKPKVIEKSPKAEPILKYIKFNDLVGATLTTMEDVKDPGSESSIYENIFKET